MPKTLSVFPVVDRILESVAGAIVSEVALGPLAWSNELVLHVVELKTNGPAQALPGLQDSFQADVGRINRILASMGGRLLPTAMHPWMDPPPRPCSGHTSTALYTKATTASSDARATAGPTCKACT